MLPTPSTSHINPSIIYEPSEDSFLLLDTLSSPSETQFLTHRFSPCPPKNQKKDEKHPPSPSPLILEVGTGSGVVLAFVAAHAQEIFGRKDILTLGTDVNPYACQATRQTVREACQDTSTTRSAEWNAADAAAGGFLAALNSDLASSIRAKMVDVLIFNPPYVPTAEVPPTTLFFSIDGQFAFEGIHPHVDENEYKSENQNENQTKNKNKNKNNKTPTPKTDPFAQNSHLLSLSYAGGTDGMQITNRLLTDLPHIINGVRGVAYILLCQQNRPDEVMERVRQWGPEWSVSVVGRSGKTGGWEKLQIIRICRG